jgi:hypothetical protein
MCAFGCGSSTCGGEKIYIPAVARENPMTTRTAVSKASLFLFAVIDDLIKSCIFLKYFVRVALTLSGIFFISPLPLFNAFVYYGAVTK